MEESERHVKKEGKRRDVRIEEEKRAQ